jgi:3-hydroxyisobutyrate dehydrogenase
MKSETIGFVGVGRMGANMARRLRDVGYSIVSVYDTNRAVAESLAKELGATAPTAVAEVSQSAQVIFTVVTDDAAMRAIYFGDPGLFSQATGNLFIDCATISQAVHI